MRWPQTHQENSNPSGPSERQIRSAVMLIRFAFSHSIKNQQCTALPAVSGCLPSRMTRGLSLEKFLPIVNGKNAAKSIDGYHMAVHKCHVFGMMSCRWFVQPESESTKTLKTQSKQEICRRWRLLSSYLEVSIHKNLSHFGSCSQDGGKTCFKKKQICNSTTFYFHTYCVYSSMLENSWKPPPANMSFSTCAFCCSPQAFMTKASLTETQATTCRQSCLSWCIFYLFAEDVHLDDIYCIIYFNVSLGSFI